MVAVAAVLDAAVVEPNWIQVTRHRVTLPIDTSLTIAHVTDLHSRGLGVRERSLIALLERERPDVIVVTGDMLAGGGRLADATAVLRRLHAPRGVWAVRGNWEHWRGEGDEEAVLRRAGIRLLDNAAHELAPALWLVGFDDALAGRPDPERALRDVPAGATVIGLFHSPGFFDRIAGRVAVALAGHTHGGQVRLPLLGPLWLPGASGRYVAGWYEHAGSRLYVSRGIGTTIAPLRFLCRPELPIVTVRPARDGRSRIQAGRNAARAPTSQKSAAMRAIARFRTHPLSRS